MEKEMSKEEVMLEVETLGSRLEFCQGAELQATLEELDALAMTYPGPVGSVIPGLMGILKDAETPEATQQAVEVVSRLCTTGDDRRKNGGLVLESVDMASSFLDLIESETCETYTAVVILELLASLCTLSPTLRTALLQAPAGLSRFMETLSDGRDEVRNASIALWRRLCQGRGQDVDECRVCCAFHDGFPKIFAALKSDGIQRDAARLAANVLRGPPVVATCLADAAPDNGLRPFAALLEALPEARTSYLESLESSAAADSGQEEEEDDDDDPPTTTTTTTKGASSNAKKVQQRRLADAARTALCAMDVLRAFLLDFDDDDDESPVKAQRMAAVWDAQSTRAALINVALLASDDSLVSAEDVDRFTTTDESEDDVDPRVALEAVSARAYEVLALAMTETSAIEAVQDPTLFGSALATVATLMTPKSKAAARFAGAALQFDAAASVAVMHAVAPPPPIDDGLEPPKPAIQNFADALVAAEKPPGHALSLLRQLLGTSTAVRELALKLTVTVQDDSRPLFSLIVEQTFDSEDRTAGLAIFVVWLQDVPSSAHLLFQDPAVAAGLATIAKADSKRRLRGLAAVVLALCLDHFDDVDRSGWTKDAVQALIDKRVGPGPFAYVPFHFVFLVDR